MFLRLSGFGWLVVFYDNAAESVSILGEFARWVETWLFFFFLDLWFGVG